MSKKIRARDVRDWLQCGRLALLTEYWTHPEFMAYRQEEIIATDGMEKGKNMWCNDVRNGDTFVFLMGQDADFRNANRSILRADSWNELFIRMPRSSWALLDVAPGDLCKKNALDTLNRLMRVNQNAQGAFLDDAYIRRLQDKLQYETQGFYRRFQQKSALTAIAWMDNQTVWTEQRPRMANMMRYAASHNPNDVLGAYLVWACDAGCKGPEGQKLFNVDRDEDLMRMQQLRILAERVGLDTSSYDEHAHRCKTLCNGLGMELNGDSILTYVQSTDMPAAPFANGEDLGALFI